MAENNEFIYRISLAQIKKRNAINMTMIEVKMPTKRREK